jgi:hypothetical protein
VALTFRDSDQPNPTKDDDGELGRLLLRLYQAFRNKDPEEKQQKALPATVNRDVKTTSNRKSESTIRISIAALFYCMRSCKYLKVPAAEK